MMADWRERYALWWEMHPGMWCFDLKGRISAWFWTCQEKLRAKVGVGRRKKLSATGRRVVKFVNVNFTTSLSHN